MTDSLDLSGFLMGHAAMRREFGLLSAVAEQQPQGRRLRLAEDQLLLVVTFVHDHHSGEDRDLWPLLSDRAPDADLSVLQEEHRDLDPLLTAVADPGRPFSTKVADLYTLHERLGEHLDHEEQVVLPLLRRHVTPAEWRALERRAASGLNIRRLPVTVGWLMSGDEALSESALAAGAAPMRWLYRTWWRPAYRRRAERLYAP